jgi:hypothetical protein
MRASEKIDSDASFLRLYSPSVLESLVEKQADGRLWNNVIYIHSSPGAGKTSLLRVFEPGSLITLFNNKSAADYKELFNILKKLDVINDDRIEVLGVTLVCTRNYEILEELDVSPAQKLRYFFSLLNARVILATLRSILNLAPSSNSFYDDLENIRFEYTDIDNYFTNLTPPCSGKDLYTWASNIERKIYKAIDSFLPISEIQPEGHDELFALSVLRPEYFQVNGKKRFSKILFMLDDAHKLSSTQRSFLKKYVIEKRGDFNVWISERLEALQPIDNLKSFEERDYEQINLEKFWSERPAKFEKILINIANKRASVSTEDVNSFKEYLLDTLNEEVYKTVLIDSIVHTRKNIDNITSFTSKFISWINYIDSLHGTTLEEAVMLKQLEIIIHRNLKKSQLTLEFSLSQNELLEKLKPEIESAAKLFLSKTHKLPYYYGFSALVKLSSNNIEQFLTFSADLFEEMLSNRLSGYQINLNVKEQERILKEIVEKKWKELNKILPYSLEIINFLTTIGEVCSKDTYLPNAPYAPGVTGFAIKTSPSLFRNEAWTDSELYTPLVNVISTCVAFNLLEIKEVNQGEKGQKWEVYYLNRWLCLKFNLPITYGGWRAKNIQDLLRWTKP